MSMRKNSFSTVVKRIYFFVLFIKYMDEIIENLLVSGKVGASVKVTRNKKELLDIIN